MFTKILESKPSTVPFPSESRYCESSLPSTLNPLISTLIEYIPEAICIVSVPDGVLLGMNQKAEELLGCKADELQDFNFLQQIAEFPYASVDIGSGEKSGTANFYLKHSQAISIHYTLTYISDRDRTDCLLLKLSNQASFDSNSPVDNTLQMLSSAVGQSVCAIIFTDSNGVVSYVNNAYIELTGYALEEVIGKYPGVIHSDGSPSECYQHLLRTIRLGGVWLGDVKEYKKNGELYWASEMIYPMPDQAGKAAHYVIAMRDITESIKDREALKQSEERFRKVAEMVDEWLWEQDAEGCYIYSSGAVSKILGLEPEEIIGQNYLSLLTKEDRDYWEYALSASSHAGKPFRKLINRYLHRDGHEVYTESSGEPLFDDKGSLLKWRGMDRDITANKQFEDILRTQERAMESANVGIVICDAKKPGFPTVYVNPALCAMTGYSREEILGSSLKLLQGPKTGPKAIEVMRSALRQGAACKLTLCNYRKDGTPFWNELRMSPVCDQHNVVTHYVGVQNDVTERLKAEEERHQLEIARQIQRSLFPKKPLKLPQIEVAGICIPTAHIGGDYFDYFQRGDWLDIVIADVSGHNVGAALIMTEMRSALRAGLSMTDSERIAYSPADILSSLNDLLHDDLSNAELFITIFYLRFDLSTRELRYANAGHNKVVLLRRAFARCEELDAEGLIIGFKRQVEFEEESVMLEAGDRLLLYTDGVTDAQDRNGNFLGVQHLSDIFIQNRRQNPTEVLDNIQHGIRRFTGSYEFRDDVTLITALIC